MTAPPMLGLPKPVHQGYDPHQVVRVRPATTDGQHAIIEQPLCKRTRNGEVFAYTYLCLTVEDSDFEASNRAAFDIAERLNRNIHEELPDE